MTYFPLPFQRITPKTTKPCASKPIEPPTTRIEMARNSRSCRKSLSISLMVLIMTLTDHELLDNMDHSPSHEDNHDDENHRQENDPADLNLSSRLQHLLSSYQNQPSLVAPAHATMSSRTEKRRVNHLQRNIDPSD